MPMRETKKRERVSSHALYQSIGVPLYRPQENLSQAESRDIDIARAQGTGTRHDLVGVPAGQHPHVTAFGLDTLYARHLKFDFGRCKRKNEIDLTVPLADVVERHVHQQTPVIQNADPVGDPLDFFDLMRGKENRGAVAAL